MGALPRSAQELDSLVRKLDSLRDVGKLVLAVSGGPDSTALMHLAAAWRRDGRQPSVAVGSVDHGLRAGSAAEAEAVVIQARALGFPAERLVWSGEKPARSLLARARTARYGLLADYARRIGASHLVTAHTLDDQAETVLMRLVCGSGLTGLAGMRSSASLDGLVLARPLLGIAKADLVALCDAEGWPYIVDPTNADRAYARSRWREAAPMLAEEGLTARRLDRLANRLARADHALDVIAAQASAQVALPKPGHRLDFALLATMPDEIVLRVMRRALSETSAVTIRLDRLEAVCTDLAASCRVRKPLVRTLAGCLLSLGRDGVLGFVAERQRRRGPGRSLQHVDGFSGPSRLVAGASLGKGTDASYIGFVDAPAREADVVETHSASDTPCRQPMLSAGPQ